MTSARFQKMLVEAETGVGSTAVHFGPCQELKFCGVTTSLLWPVMTRANWSSMFHHLVAGLDSL